jgi:hypothetical protein
VAATVTPEGTLLATWAAKHKRDLLPQRDQYATMMFANHGVTLPVADRILLIHNLRTLVNAHPVRDGAPRRLPTGLSLVAGLLTAQVPPQVATPAIVTIDVLVDGFVTEL